MDFWDEEENVSEYELMLEDINENEELADKIESGEYEPEASITEEEYEEINEASAFDLDLEEADVVNNTRIRLEQAKLYEMLINHDIFEGVDVNKNAVKVVQEELKGFIIERLEILMGIRQEKQKLTTTTIRVSSPFNDIEVEFLKALAYKGTHGKSSEGSHETVIEEVKPAITKPKKLAPKKLAPKKLEKVEAKPMAIKPIKKELPKQQIVKKEPPKKQIVKKQAVKPARSKIEQQVHKTIKSNSMKERKMTKQEAEALAKEDLKNTMNQRPFHELSTKEKQQRIAEVNARHARNKQPDNVAPIPSPEQLEAHYTMQQQLRSSRPNTKGQLNNIIANAIAAQKNQGE